MPDELKIPQVGESITQVQISEWLKSEGDEVKQDEAVAIIDSEKTTFELPAPKAGRLVKILHQAGETVNVGETVAQIEANGETAQEAPKKPEPAAKPKTEAKRPTKSNDKPKITKPSGEPTTDNESTPKPPANDSEPVGINKTEPAPPSDEESAPEEVKETPPAEKAAPQPQPPKASAPIKTESSEPPAESDEEVVPMTMLRRTVARRLVEAQQTMAMLTTFNEVDMSAVQALRKAHQEAFEKRHQVKLGLSSFFVKAAIDALKQFPKLNAEIRNNDVVYRNYYNIGVAIATERGLVVPSLTGAERLSFAELEKAIGDFARRGKEGKLKPDELAGGTFTITNGGVFGSLLSTPIINPPQTGILGLHAIQDRPIALEGQVVIRPMMYLALTYDHRLVDGREAVLFLRRVKELIETPARILIEI